MEFTENQMVEMFGFVERMVFIAEGVWVVFKGGMAARPDMRLL